VRFFSEVGMLVQSVAVGWQLYAITHSPLALGLAGAAQFVPILLLTLPAGDICDRFGSRKILALSLGLTSLCSAALIFLTLSGTHMAAYYYVVLVFYGSARAFYDPSMQSLLPFLIPRESLQRSLPLSSSAQEIAVIGGPALGGFIYNFAPVAAYAASCGAFFFALIAIGLLRGGGAPHPEVGPIGRHVERVKEGLQFIRSRPVVLGAISLDLFAVLLGGAETLLPIFARDILKIGAFGLGVMRSAPAVGAVLMALFLARRPLSRNIGRTLFAAVAVFGCATIAFGVSRSLVISLMALVLMGASDQISVFIRAALVQLATPDALRGRVSAVNMLFVGASSDLGGFESGAVAALFGAVPSVLIGGIGTLFVAAIWMKLFPALRTVDALVET
jgi:MFS family permease